MATFMIYHEVDDLATWLASSNRDDMAAAFEGMTTRTFVDPTGANRAGMLIEIPDDLVPAFQQVAQSEDALEKGKADGVRLDTMVMLVEA
jgi:hypothetical protein